MHTFDNLQQLNIEWKCKNGSADEQRKGSGNRRKASRPSNALSATAEIDRNKRDDLLNSDVPPKLTRQDGTRTPTHESDRSSPISSNERDSTSNIEFQKIISDGDGLVQWAIEQGLKMPDYVQSILGNSKAQISELKYMMRIVKRPEARYGCIACEGFRCNQYVDFKMHMRERHQFPQSKMWECGNCQ